MAVLFRVIMKKQSSWYRNGFLMRENFANCWWRTMTRTRYRRAIRFLNVFRNPLFILLRGCLLSKLYWQSIFPNQIISRINSELIYCFLFALWKLGIEYRISKLSSKSFCVVLKVDVLLETVVGRESEI